MAGVGVTEAALLLGLVAVLVGLVALLVLAAKASAQHVRAELASPTPAPDH
ncbi:MAG TPA: hypothetical protein VIL36_12855 [Acidimicrobiales bacterium]